MSAKEVYDTQLANNLIPNAVSKMSMGGSSSMSSSHACKISMLWNWYTIDSCFIARSWHVKSKGGFAGSCIGVFFLVLASQWLHRFCREYDLAIIRKHEQKLLSLNGNHSNSSDLSNKFESANVISVGSLKHLNPFVLAVSHKWLLTRSDPGMNIIPDPFEHLLRSILFTIEWGLSYIIMLLFMYYNGYIIISCILGALFGKLLFTYNEALSCRGENRSGLDSEESDRKCCR